MLELARMLYTALGINSPKIFIALSALIGAIIFGALAWLFVLTGKSTPPTSPAPLQAPAPTTQKLKPSGESDVAKPKEHVKPVKQGKWAIQNAPYGMIIGDNAKVDHPTINNFGVGADPVRNEIQEIISKMDEFKEARAQEGQINNIGSTDEFRVGTGKKFDQQFAPRLRRIQQALIERNQPRLAQKIDQILSNYEGGYPAMDSENVDIEKGHLREILDMLH
jgi:hypothetical protein